MQVRWEGTCGNEALELVIQEMRPQRRWRMREVQREHPSLV
jgi:hypothetical protein